MINLTKDDLKDIVSQVRDDWQFRHNGEDCPHNLTTKAFGAVIEDDYVFELQVTRHLPREA